MISIDLNTTTYFAMQWLEKEIVTRNRGAKNNNLPMVNSLVEWEFLAKQPDYEQPEMLRKWVHGLNIQFPKHPAYVNEFWSTWLHNRLQELSYSALVEIGNKRKVDEQLAPGYSYQDGHHYPISDVFEDDFRFFLQNNYDVRVHLKQSRTFFQAQEILFNLRIGRERYTVGNPPSVLKNYMHGWYRDCYTSFTHMLTGEIWFYMLGRNDKAKKILEEVLVESK